MQKLGFTRSAYQPDHLLLTPDTFVRAPRPGMTQGTAIVHVAPAVGAGFTQYTAELAAGGTLGPAEGQRFVYVMEGAVTIQGRELGAGGYAYIPEGCDAPVSSAGATRASIIEKAYVPREGVNPPALFLADEREVAGKPLNDDPGLIVRSLIPDDPAFDFAVNTMVYAPGAALSMVEIHVMEHGLVMLEGGGIYRLGERWYHVTAGDFIWMAPYCPQWFGALGKTPAKYLIYKDWNR
jgi:(S)-ureidoglycine aminohydrolase